jgi:arylsulfatase A-like enzyme
MLKKLDDLGIANNTIVIYTTDNGAETFSWPDGAPRHSKARRTQSGKADIVCPR